MIIYPDIYTDPMGEVQREYLERMKACDSTEVQLLMECLQKAWLEATKKMTVTDPAYNEMLQQMGNKLWIFAPSFTYGKLGYFLKDRGIH